MLGLKRKIGGSLALLCVLVAGCGGDGGSSGEASPFKTGPCSPASAPGGPYCLRFNGSGYNIHVGQKFQVALVSADGNNTVVAGKTVVSLPGETFSIDLPQSMVAGVPYYVDYYADNNHNGTCNAPTLPGDHVWRSHAVIDFYHGTIATVTATTHDVAWSAPHDDPFVNDPTGMNTCAQLNQLP